MCYVYVFICAMPINDVVMCVYVDACDIAVCTCMCMCYVCMCMCVYVLCVYVRARVVLCVRHRASPESRVPRAESRELPLVLTAQASFTQGTPSPACSSMHRPSALLVPSPLRLPPTAPTLRRTRAYSPVDVLYTLYSTSTLCTRSILPPPVAVAVPSASIKLNREEAKLE